MNDVTLVFRLADDKIKTVETIKKYEKKQIKKSIEVLINDVSHYKELAEVRDKNNEELILENNRLKTDISKYSKRINDLTVKNEELIKENKLVTSWLNMYNVKLDKIKDIIKWFHEE